MKKLAEHTLNPTANQTFELEGTGPWNFIKRLRTADELQAAGRIEAACEERYQAVQYLEELLPEEEAINLEWNHANSRAALQLLYGSGVDHFLIGDFELSAALMELLLELDPEDHLEAVNLLGFNYVQLEEFDLLEEIIDDISEKEPARAVLQLWAAYRRKGELPATDLQRLKRSFSACFEEFTATEHPLDETFLQEVNSEHPSPKTRARELWLQTEPLWNLNRDFIEALRTAQKV